ncbi:MAG: response regulator transcription factor [Anaerolineae bacterium]|nr:response regulator transcription factor [Anaerolineae bacterium]
MMPHQVLVVDDENTFRYFLALHLKDAGYGVSEAASGQAALRLIAEKQFEVALVDLRLPDMNGLEVMRQLRQTTPQTSVIILTGYATLDSAIEALRQGAHDYLTKPCNTDELLASVADSIARQTVDQAAGPTSLANDTLFRVKDLTLNLASRQVDRGGQSINLTPTEFDILATLMAEPDTAIDAIRLIKAVRGYEATEADARAIARVHVHRLRHKLEIDPSQPQYVVTVAGGRYLINSA